MAYGFTPEELRRIDQEIEEEPLTMEEIQESRKRDKAAKLERKNNKEKKITETQRAYYKANREKIAETQRAYREANREKIKEYMREYMREKRRKEQK